MGAQKSDSVLIGLWELWMRKDGLFYSHHVNALPQQCLLMKKPLPLLDL